MREIMRGVMEEMDWLGLFIGGLMLTVFTLAIMFVLELIFDWGWDVWKWVLLGEALIVLAIRGIWFVRCYREHKRLNP